MMRSIEDLQRRKRNIQYFSELLGLGVLIVLITVALSATVYYFFSIEPYTTSSRAGTAGRKEQTRLQKRIDKNGILSGSSDKLSDIKKDLDSVKLDNIDLELRTIDSEIVY